jgi:hypothetical protein
LPRPDATLSPGRLGATPDVHHGLQTLETWHVDQEHDTSASHNRLTMYTPGHAGGRAPVPELRQVGLQAIERRGARRKRDAGRISHHGAADLTMRNGLEREDDTAAASGKRGMQQPKGMADVAVVGRL